MRLSSLVRPAAVVLAGTTLLIGCAANSGTFSHTAEPAAARDRLPARKITRSSEQVVTVDSAAKVAADVARFVTEAGGFVERSSDNGHGGAAVRCKVPAPAVEPLMNRVAALGHEERRSLTANDITDQYTDLEARLKSSVAVRDRLEQLLSHTTGLADVLTVERELARVQADIEAMQARLEQLKSQVELAELSITLHRKRQIGPLSYVGVGLWRGLSKLF
jgi:hypothetical protein